MIGKEYILKFEQEPGVTIVATSDGSGSGRLVVEGEGRASRESKLIVDRWLDNLVASQHLPREVYVDGIRYIPDLTAARK